MKKVTTHNSPGRPKYQPRFPRKSEWTFNDFMAANEVDTNMDHKGFGKGPHCTMLTLRKFLAGDLARLGKSVVVRHKGVSADPVSDKGLGRRGYVYSLRAKFKGKVKAVKAKTTRKPKSNAGEVTKAIAAAKEILADTPPAVTIAPEATPTPAPAATVEAPTESPAPVAAA